ncbi:HD domain-containing protein [Glaciimonas sp. CA11.2]|uniref:phosphonate degradation HD-domain oxygenase n=1 Tax=unclassified Glaciimonas TaxID=2644401 RepID=UPI002AB33562|nr:MULTISPECIES: phosphonate degradation HD-domain oxygenase [unclassified Glaciimonas]MDY7545531.1 HD domain-containing protein [Glaciimonas sp. CA11.2]MEB0012782.1 HD domain-containing protein [Glaciimonas sp. Cout2]MEB0082260.1 HD domain-containing protein [Glaciimonas sp. Gout2]MEB0163302.1 HD domain-containing protein [Glaciimonas sp. CA11.2]
MLSIPEICGLFEDGGHAMYSGEPVSQREHALQTATLAAQAGATSELICAALLHDLGHLLNPQGETPSERGIDDTHQYFAIPYLRGLFSPAVLEPIRMHVDAKRYLCAIDSTYYDQLSDDSKRSLALQGGVFSTHAAAEFIARPYAADAVSLRLWDDLAKDADMVTPAMPYFATLMADCALTKVTS